MRQVSKSKYELRDNCSKTAYTGLLPRVS